MLNQINKFGWEIGSHGVTHRNLLKLSLPDVEYELSESKKFLTKYFGEIISYAYPYGDYNKLILRSVKKFLNRNVKSVLVANANFYVIIVTCFNQ